MANNNKDVQFELQSDDNKVVTQRMHSLFGYGEGPTPKDVGKGAMSLEEKDREQFRVVGEKASIAS